MRSRRLLVTLLAGVLALAGPVGIARADDDPTQNKDHNEVQAVNTEDGSSIFRFALSIQHVTDGVIDQTNKATAQASCVDCATVALAFQVILVSGSAETVVPENRAVAENVECQECLTYAKATQIVVGIDGKELSDNGKRRLRALEKRMRELEREADEMSDAELFAAAQAAEAELRAIFNEELVPIEDKNASNGTTTTTSSTTSSTTSTTVRSTTTTTDPPETTTTTTAAA